RKLAHDVAVDLPLEGRGQVRQLRGVGPAPGVELSLVATARGDVDLRLLADKAHGEPLLPLPAVSALQGDAEQIRRQIVAEPVGRLREQLDACHPGLLLELAQRRRALALAGC